MSRRASEATDADGSVPRRRLLAAGAAALALTAGCTGDGGSTPDGDGSSGDATPTATGTEAPTDSPTAAETDTPGEPTATETATETDRPTATETATETDRPTATETATETPESGVDLEAASAVDGLAITDLDYDAADRVVVTITVRNDGDGTTDSTNYNYTLTVYDADGDDITSGRTSSGSAMGSESELAPGATGELLTSVSVEGETSDIARVAVALNCEGASGSYCGG
jgi:hypothetical protein